MKDIGPKIPARKQAARQLRQIEPDTFVFKTQFGSKTIADFDADIDRIDLSALETNFDELTIEHTGTGAAINTDPGMIDIDRAPQLKPGHFLFQQFAAVFFSATGCEVLHCTFGPGPFESLKINPHRSAENFFDKAGGSGSKMWHRRLDTYETISFSPVSWKQSSREKCHE